MLQCSSTLTRRSGCPRLPSSLWPLLHALQTDTIVTRNGIALEHVVIVQDRTKGGDLQYFLAQQRVSNTSSTAPVSSGDTIERRSSFGFGK
ncbi:hypothetical protein GN244_ATG02742 [Phytophthora infestans]|uniref:Uncharacterized protein n=1 Tax=Phytophthora infestans TaxID=4787 RepID=A0A833TAV6_PHYIN|nr:hypothetical protein GN244_ATG02742 [Phytophthora infestans]KAF4138504.1 hypothetical protein GN958_ATG12246 [Phytophthora infestans]